MGNFRFGYSAYVSNGPQLAVDSLELGMLKFGLEFNNANQALGGRLELVHVSNAGWEIGLSGMFGEAGPDELQAMAVLGAVNLSYQRPLPLLR